MLEQNEPSIIKYEEISLPDEPEEEQKPGTSKESEDRGNTENEAGDDEDEETPEDFDFSEAEMDEDPEKGKSIQEETISKLLDFIFPPRKVQREGKSHLLRLSRENPGRDEIVELSHTFENCLEERQVRMNGYCPIRRELYDLLFDELIRQATICCAERGSLLLRIRDEFRMTMRAHDQLFETGVEYGSRKALEAELETRKMEIQVTEKTFQYEQLKDEVSRAEKRVQDLEAQISSEESQCEQRMNANQAKHDERMEFLRKLNRQLKEQMSYIS